MRLAMFAILLGCTNAAHAADQLQRACDRIVTSFPTDTRMRLTSAEHPNEPVTCGANLPEPNLDIMLTSNQIGYWLDMSHKLPHVQQ